MMGEVSIMLDDEVTASRRQYPRIRSENVVMIHRIGPAEQAEMATARQMARMVSYSA